MATVYHCPIVFGCCEKLYLYLLMNVFNKLLSLQVELFADVVVRCCVGDLYEIRAISYRGHTTLISQINTVSCLFAFSLEICIHRRLMHLLHVGS